MAATFRLFVYGTLKRGGVRHHALVAQRFIREVRTLPRYVVHDLGPYPGMVASAGGHAIQGELYEVDEAAIPLLDRLEGAPDLFRREPVALEGVDEPAFAYFYQGDPRLPGPAAGEG